MPTETNVTAPEIENLTEPTRPSNAPTPIGNEWVMSRGEAARSRKPGLRQLKCRAWTVIGDGAWLTDGGRTREDARIYTVEEAIGRCGDDNTLFYIEGLVSITPEPLGNPNDPPVRVKKSSWTAYVDAQLKAMLMSAPTNATFRARLMARMGEMPPADADTWLKLVEWIEYNFPKSGGRPPNVMEPILVSCDVTESESGRCTYSRDLKGRGIVTVTADMIKDAADETYSQEDFWCGLFDKVRDAAIADIQTDTESETTEDHEPSGDGDGMEVNYRQNELVARVKLVVGRILDQDKLDELEL